jgi:hypothetical protein
LPASHCIPAHSWHSAYRDHHARQKCVTLCILPCGQSLGREPHCCSSICIVHMSAKRSSGRWDRWEFQGHMSRLSLRLSLAAQHTLTTNYVTCYG